MTKRIFLVLKWLGILAGIFVLLIAGFFGFLTITEFSPPARVNPAIGGIGQAMNGSKRQFTFLTWNIGYAGLGRGTDFFYDGGKMVRPSREQCLGYFAGIRAEVQKHEVSDFIFLQEVDVHSKRSWYLDEFDSLSVALKDRWHAFAQNYGCLYIPVPIHEPMGRVAAGLATFSRFQPAGATAGYYKTDLSWPKRLAFLKRCYLMLRFHLDNGKDLVVLNTHNSAYDSTGIWRKHEMALLDSVMTAEFQRGNYVVCGGDWNSNPRGYHPGAIVSGDRGTVIEPPIDSGFMPGWQFVFDPSLPSNRYTDMPYKKGVTRTTIIDFFVVSPNIEVTVVSAVSMGFAFSDHHPVMMGVRLKPDPGSIQGPGLTP